MGNEGKLQVHRSRRLRRPKGISVGTRPTVSPGRQAPRTWRSRPICPGSPASVRKNPARPARSGFISLAATPLLGRPEANEDAGRRTQVLPVTTTRCPVAPSPDPTDSGCGATNAERKTGAVVSDRPSTDPTPDATDALTSFWEQRYRERERVWSGQPNAAVVRHVAPLGAGRALDLGCGEGADAIWLASRGWRVEAVDVSPTAIGRGRQAADEAGLPSDAIRWATAHLAHFLPSGPYDLVSACFLHSPVPFPRLEVLRRAAAEVVSGGHLLVVEHAAPPPWAADRDAHHWRDPTRELADLGLDPEDWETLRAGEEHRRAIGPDGREAELTDAVLLLRHRPSLGQPAS